VDEVVVVMGFNAAGKSTLTQGYVDKGYHRLNRDEQGGTMAKLDTLLLDALASGRRRVVLDNTYPDKESRKGVIACAIAQGVPINCVWLSTSFEDAQLNACLRMIQRTGRLLGPEDFKTTKDPNLFPPAALFAYKKKFERPSTNEGFTTVVESKFVRQYDPTWTHSALILDCDGVLRTSSGKEHFPCKPDDVVPIPGRGAFVRGAAKNYDFLLGISNQSGIAKKKLTSIEAEACFAKTNELQELNIPWHYCPHNIPPMVCFCRKPSCGLGAVVMTMLKLDPRKCLYVGDMTTDSTFAKRCGFSFSHEKDFFN
jgi:HAD superfamily hydrolase (TIGR01662 family)